MSTKSRSVRLGVAVIAASALHLVTACESKPSLQERYSDKPPSSGTASAPHASASAKPKPSASASANRPRVPRPVPIGSAGPIQPNAPQEQQMMAIQYCIAMASPTPADPIFDEAAVTAMIKKLGPAVRSADKGKTPPDPVSLKGKRVIAMEMAIGCTPKAPANILASRAGIPLKKAYDAGILVLKCHDNKWACHQSTRTPEDVLCHAAPRRQPL